MDLSPLFAEILAVRIGGNRAEEGEELRKRQSQGKKQSSRAAQRQWRAEESHLASHIV